MSAWFNGSPSSERMAFTRAACAVFEGATVVPTASNGVAAILRVCNTRGRNLNSEPGRAVVRFLGGRGGIRRIPPPHGL